MFQPWFTLEEEVEKESPTDHLFFGKVASTSQRFSVQIREHKLFLTVTVTVTVFLNSDSDLNRHGSFVLDELIRNGSAPLIRLQQGLLLKDTYTLHNT